MCCRCALSLMGWHNAALNLPHIHRKRDAVCMKLFYPMLVRVDTDLSYRIYSMGSGRNGGRGVWLQRSSGRSCAARACAPSV